jgi:hypothetical protein
VAAGHHVELGVGAMAGRSGGEPWLRRRVSVARRSLRIAAVAVRLARREIRARGAALTAPVRFGGRPRRIGEVHAVALTLSRALHEAPNAPVRRVLGRGLVVTALPALVLVHAELLGIDPVRGILALAPALVPALASWCAMVLVALDVGQRLRRAARAFPVPEPPVAALAGGALLLFASGALATALAVWVQARGTGPVAVAAGLLLGLAAIAGPLVVVADEVYGQGADGRTLARAERVLGRWLRRTRRHERRAAARLDRAEGALLRAEHVAREVGDALGCDHALVAGLEEECAALRAAVTVARADLGALIDPATIGPEDLDLAG